MANQSKKIRNFGESLVAHAKVINLAKEKRKAGEFDLSSKVESFGSAGYEVESSFKMFNGTAKYLVQKGLTIDDSIMGCIHIFNEQTDNFQKMSNQIKDTPLKDNLLGYFPQELNYIAQRN